MSIKNTDLGYI